MVTGAEAVTTTSKEKKNEQDDDEVHGCKSVEVGCSDMMGALHHRNHGVFTPFAARSEILSQCDDGTLPLEVLTHAGHDLPVGHFVSSFNHHGAVVGYGFFKLCAQMTFGFTRPHDQDRPCISQAGYDFSIVVLELRGVLPLVHIIRCSQQGFMRLGGVFSIDVAGLPMCVREDFLDFFACSAMRDDHRPSLVKPQAHVGFHRFILVGCFRRMILRSGTILAVEKLSALWGLHPNGTISRFTFKLIQIETA